MWGMFFAKPPRTASLEEQAKLSTKTTGVWLKSGWMISRISSISSHQVRRSYMEHKVPIQFSLASNKDFIVGEYFKVGLRSLRILSPLWCMCAHWYYKLLRRFVFLCLILLFSPISHLCPPLDFYTALVISKLGLTIPYSEMLFFFPPSVTLAFRNVSDWSPAWLKCTQTMRLVQIERWVPLHLSTR